MNNFAQQIIRIIPMTFRWVYEFVFSKVVVLELNLVPARGVMCMQGGGCGC